MEGPTACPWLGHLASGLVSLTLVCYLRLPVLVKLASDTNLLAHYAKGTLSPKLQLLKLAQSFRPLWASPTLPGGSSMGEAGSRQLPGQERRARSLTVLYATDHRVRALGVVTPVFDRGRPTSDA